MRLEPSIRNDLVELIAASFKTDQVNELGRLILGSFDTNYAAGRKNHISLSSRKGADLLVEHCEDRRDVDALLKLVVELDGGVVHGRPVRVSGLEEFLAKLTRSGIHYDFRHRRISRACRDPGELVNWGCLKDGREYDLTVLSLDVVGNSAKVRRLGARRMEKTYYGLWRFLREKLAATDGRVWSWAGDGGLIAFALADHAARAVRFAIEVQSTVPVFNVTTSGSAAGDVALRMGIDTGRVKFSIETGSIVSDVINYAAHLEKKRCRPGTVCVSREVLVSLPPRMASLFRPAGIFEERDCFRTGRRLDSLLDDGNDGDDPSA